LCLLRPLSRPSFPHSTQQNREQKKSENQFCQEMRQKWTEIDVYFLQVKKNLGVLLSVHNDKHFFLRQTPFVTADESQEAVTDISSDDDVGISFYFFFNLQSIFYFFSFLPLFSGIVSFLLFCVCVLRLKIFNESRKEVLIHYF